MKLPITLVLDHVRSAHNVGAIFRTAEAVGASQIITCGLTPHPKIAQDERLPHVAERTHHAIAKTALGAERSVPCRHMADAQAALDYLRADGLTIYALEQSPGAISVFDWQPRLPCAIMLGHERSGISDQILKQADQTIEIPQYGAKESLNVAVAAGVALYHLLSRTA